jgi:acetyltransferase-like isoleucine patch superfamily enzyme
VRRLRVLFGVAIALLPSWLKVPLYRWLYGYRIGRGVRIGFSPFIGVGRCRLGDHARIGSFNFFYRVEELEIGAHAQVGFGNIIRGGRRVSVGPYATILRLNVFNAILDGDFLEPVSSTLELGPGVVVTSGHWLDFSERITVGGHSIIGGRNSSFWTHNRQRSRAITVGHHCYLASEVRLAPGAELPPLCILALGSVLVGRVEQERSLVGGNPAAMLRALEDRDLFLVCRKTRKDIPDEVALTDLPRELWEAVRCCSLNQGGPVS